MPSTSPKPVRDIKPQTPINRLKADFSQGDLAREFDLEFVAVLVGMSPTYVRKALGARSPAVSLEQVLDLLELDAFSETFIPRSKIPSYLLSRQVSEADREPYVDQSQPHLLLHGAANDLIHRLPRGSVQCVVTSTPYWGMRLYSEHFNVNWADGQVCAFGHEQTPEAFIRHTVEILYHLKDVITKDGSIWWNLGDSYNTRTQIRGNAAETLNAMKGNDDRGWQDHECRRYSAGHSYLKDGEQCLIPQRVAERASRIGYWVKSTVTWKKTGSMPEPVGSRVTRELEHILHLSIQRAPYFDKNAFRRLPEPLGGRNRQYEAEKLTDVWALSTASGQDGHGAQFPLALPARCIALTSRPGDLVLDPFVGSGTTILAAHKLNRRTIGIDISEEYIAIARRLIEGSLSQLELV